MSGTASAPEGITNPPIDELLEATDSKYSLVIYASKRARQINAYYSQLGEGLLEYVGPLVETHVQEKPLSIALREINAGLLTAGGAMLVPDFGRAVPGWAGRGHRRLGLQAAKFGLFAGLDQGLGDPAHVFGQADGLLGKGDLTFGGLRLGIDLG